MRLWRSTSLSWQPYLRRRHGCWHQQAPHRRLWHRCDGAWAAGARPSQPAHWHTRHTGRPLHLPRAHASAHAHSADAGAGARVSAARRCRYHRHARRGVRRSRTQQFGAGQMMRFKIITDTLTWKDAVICYRDGMPNDCYWEWPSTFSYVSASTARTRKRCPAHTRLRTTTATVATLPSCCVSACALRRPRRTSSHGVHRPRAVAGSRVQVGSSCVVGICCRRRSSTHVAKRRIANTHVHRPQLAPPRASHCRRSSSRSAAHRHRCRTRR